LIGNQASLATGPSIYDFNMLNTFKVRTHSPKAPIIIEVLWQPPIIGWIKFNTDGAAYGCPSPSACVDLFRYCHSEHLGKFAEFFDILNAFSAKLLGIMKAIGIAFDIGCHLLWLECDSKLAMLAFNKNPQMIPWHLWNCCENCLFKTLSMNFLITNIFRKRIIAQTNQPILVFLCIAMFGGLDSRNRLGLSYFRFCQLRVLVYIFFFIFFNLFSFISFGAVLVC
jgi:hypothetical protein